MTGGRSRRRRRPHTYLPWEKTWCWRSSSASHPSPTLVRAALTCWAWRRAVASSPDFRRRFRSLHPVPPLLGIFLYSIDIDELYRPLLRPWWSLLERSPNTKSSSYPYWEILDCCGGRILLTDMFDEDKPLIVLNPLMRRSGSAHEFRYPGPDQYPINPRLICLDEEPPSSFRVALLAYSGCTLQASVYSSDTGQWSALPSVDVPAWSADDGTSGEDRTSDDASDKILIEDDRKMHVNGFIYWVYVWCGDGRTGRYLISLDTTTMEFSFAKLPQCLQKPDYFCRLTMTFHAGREADDGAVCIVYSDGSNNVYSDGSNKVGVVKHTRNDDGIERWVPDRVFRLELDGELKRLNLGNPYCCNQLSVLAVKDGYVYFSISEPVTLDDPRRGCSWFMSLCLATMKVEKLFERSYDDEAYAYIMPWPPCLLAGNYGQFAFEGAP